MHKNNKNIFSKLTKIFTVIAVLCCIILCLSDNDVIIIITGLTGISSVITGLLCAIYWDFLDRYLRK